MEFNDGDLGDFFGESIARVDASYDGSLFATLWTFNRVYSIQMPQTHCKIINLTKIFMD
jgi:hypothetical protein